MSSGMGNSSDELALAHQSSTGSDSVDVDGELTSAVLNSYFSSITSPTATPAPEDCLATFDLDGDGGLDLPEFTALCRALFRDDTRGVPYKLDSARVERLFGVFDRDGDGQIDAAEFGVCWRKWVTKILHPIAALLVIDVQNDFISGSLAVGNCPAGQDGADVVEPINRLLEHVPFATVVYSLDWHPADHVSFARNVRMRPLDASSAIQDPEEAKEYDLVVFQGPPVTRSQVLWPAHCVQGSWGAELHEGLAVAQGAVFIHKGTNPDIDSYSAFWDNAKLSETEMRKELDARCVTDVYVVGLAYDFCVGSTAMHALEHGYRTVIVDDACRGMKVEDIQDTRDKVEGGSGLVVEVDRVKNMVTGKDRRPELGYALAMSLKLGEKD